MHSQSSESGAVTASKRLIWDLPTRLFHWLLVAGIIFQYVTVEFMDNAVQLHFYGGYFMLGLILFRLVWGFVGSDYAKFSHFITGPVRVINYARTLFDSNSPAHAGHNPLGGWVVAVMLTLIALQAISGLFLTDDVFLDGPYRALVSGETQDIMNVIHHQGFNLLMLVIVAHVSAIVFYAVFKKQRLVPAMVHGKKVTHEAAITSSRILLAIVVALICAAVVYYAIAIAPPAPAEELYY